MVENSNLDELAEAARLEPGDAKKAWRLLSNHIEGTDLPAWVKAYVQRSAVAVADYDLESGDQAKLAHDLGFYKEAEQQDGWSYDLDDVFEWFTDRMMKDAQDDKKIMSVVRIFRNAEAVS